MAVRTDLLNVLSPEPGGSKFFHFRLKFDDVIELHEVRHKLLICGSAWKSFQAALCYSGPGSLTVPKRKLLVIYCQG